MLIVDMPLLVRQVSGGGDSEFIASSIRHQSGNTLILLHTA